MTPKEKTEVEAEEFIGRLSRTNDALAKATSTSLGRWMAMKHNKECLETFLNHNIAAVTFVTEKNEKKKVVCSSNTVLIRMLNSKTARSASKRSGQIPSTRSRGMRSRSTKSVITWDLVKNDYCTINLRSWEISIPFLEISPDNVQILVESAKDILEKRLSERNRRR